MPRSIARTRRLPGGLLALAGLMCLAGCRTYTVGQQLPSAQYLQMPPTIVPPSMPVAPPPTVAKVPAAMDPYVAELLGIMQETKSVDAFLMTLNLLVVAKADHRVAVPVVLRNAERLGICANRMVSGKDGPMAEAQEMLTRGLEMLANPEKGPAAGNRPPLSRKADVPEAPWQLMPADCLRPILRADFKTPILPPIKPGERPICENPPSLAEVLSALPPQLTPPIPGIFEVSRDDVEITLEKLTDRIDPPRFFPLVGPAQLHHCHWKCTVHYKQTITANYPYLICTSRPCVEVVYIDRDQLHLCAPDAGAQKAVTKDLASGDMYSPDPNIRTEQLLAGSQDLRQMRDEWERFWQKDEPSHLTAQRVSSPIGSEPMPVAPPYRIAPPDNLYIAMPSASNPVAAQKIIGEHLVRPDGTIALGIYGSVQVSGLTTAEAGKAVEKYLGQYLASPEVAVEVRAYNSQVYYVISDDGLRGNPLVIRMPLTGRPTVLDAVAAVVNDVRAEKVSVTRLSSNNEPPQVLPVDYRAIVQLGDATTNYQLRSGDRVYVQGKANVPRP